MNAYDISLERGRLCVVLATVVINVVPVSLFDIRAVVGLAADRSKIYRTVLLTVAGSTRSQKIQAMLFF